jgi:hypothetical protein
VGFRVKRVEVIEISGLKMHLEDAPVEKEDIEVQTEERVLFRGALNKSPLNDMLGAMRRRDFVLQRGKLSWVRAAQSEPLSVKSATASDAFAQRFAPNVATVRPKRLKVQRLVALVCFIVC